MSSGDPVIGSTAPGGGPTSTIGWAPPVGYRPRTAVYVLAVLMPLLLVAGLVAPAAVLWASRSAGQIGPSGTPLPAGSNGQPGVGDPYYPDYGSSGYDARKYVISVDWDPGAGRLTGRTTMIARAVQPLESFYVDLALEAESVTVDGAPAQVQKEGFQDLRITPQQPIASGTDFEVAISYAGQPGSVRRDGRTSWQTKGEEWTTAGEPESSVWWYPANDHPSDPALMDVSVRVPTGLQVISVGRLESRDRADEPSHDTWHWISRQPMATYLNFISIGRYQIDAGVVDGRPYVYAVTEQLNAADRARALAVLRTSGQIVRELEALFGPYPFSEVGGIVAAPDFAFAGLETQTRPIYKTDAILNADFAPTLIAHELAHMWFGDQVTLRQWNDIFLNEAYASWAEWGVAERRPNRRTANQRLNDTYERTKGNADFWRVTMIDPGVEDLFSTVYVRGPMALQALRNVIGDEAFFALGREWARDGGPRSLEEWMVAAQAKTTVDLEPFYQAWIRADTVPERTAANGFRD
jgi:aminopeptidase N